MSESDSDSDYQDVGAEAIANGNIEERRVGGRINDDGIRVRGKDVNWFEVEKFENVEDFNESVIKKDLQDNFTLRRAREPDYADTEHYTCKFSRKVGFVPCLLQY